MQNLLRYQPTFFRGVLAPLFMKVRRLRRRQNVVRHCLSFKNVRRLAMLWRRMLLKRNGMQLNQGLRLLSLHALTRRTTFRKHCLESPPCPKPPLRTRFWLEINRHNETFKIFMILLTFLRVLGILLALEPRLYSRPLVEAWAERMNYLVAQEPRLPILCSQRARHLGSRTL